MITNKRTTIQKAFKHITNPNLEINDGDRIILFSLSKMIKKVENLLSVRFRFY